MQSRQLTRLCFYATLTPMKLIDYAMPRDKSPTVQITVRIPRDVAERAERLVLLLSRPGTEATLTTVIREAVDRGVTSLEAEFSKAPTAKKGGSK